MPEEEVYDVIKRELILITKGDKKPIKSELDYLNNLLKIIRIKLGK